MNREKLPLEYLLTSSQAGLEGFELGRLDKISHLRKQLRSLVDQWVQAEIEAELARWLLECQRAQQSAAGSRSPEPSFPLPGATLAAAFLPLPGTYSALALPARSSRASRKRLSANSAAARPPLAPRNARLRQQEDELALLQAHTHEIVQQQHHRQAHPHEIVQQQHQQAHDGVRQRGRANPHQLAPAFRPPHSRTLPSKEGKTSLDFLEEHMRSETQALGPSTQAQHSCPSVRVARTHAYVAHLVPPSRKHPSLANSHATRLHLHSHDQPTPTPLSSCHHVASIHR